MKAREWGILALGAIALGAAPASALDTVAGTYEGKATCRQIVAGAASKSKHDVVMSVVNPGATLSLQITGSADFAATGTVDGTVAGDAAKPDRGAFTGFACGGSGVNGIAVHGDVVVKSTGRASVKGTILQADEPTDAVRICTFAVKRTAINAPPVIPCTPAP
jgi:hypothetical protein